MLRNRKIFCGVAFFMADTVTVTESLQGKMGNGLKVASFLYE
jgi:hypothetical protein